MPKLFATNSIPQTTACDIYNHQKPDTLSSFYPATCFTFGPHNSQTTDEIWLLNSAVFMKANHRLVSHQNQHSVNKIRFINQNFTEAQSSITLFMFLMTKWCVPYTLVLLLLATMKVGCVIFWWSLFLSSIQYRY